MASKLQKIPVTKPSTKKTYHTFRLTLEKTLVKLLGWKAGDTIEQVLDVNDKSLKLKKR